MRYQAVIIGAGLSGLAAGARLAHFGKRVLLLERHTVWGGLNSFYKQGGYHFDTGLHALTNWVRPGYRGPRTPLQRICRQLRLSMEELELDPQTRSEIRFPSLTLSFDNDFARLEAEIAQAFPGQVEGLRKLRARCADYPQLSRGTAVVSSRRMLSEYLSEPLLREMLLAPILFYGSAEEDDIDFDQFIILWRSIYEEGFCRPRGGIRPLLDKLRRRVEAGAELRRGVGVDRLEVQAGKVQSLHLSDGTVVEAEAVISSAGLVETMRLRSDLPPDTHAADAGQLAFIESMWVLDTTPRALGHDACVSFCSGQDRFFWSRPQSPIELSSAVVCCPGNYGHPQPHEPPMVRATHLADWAGWLSWPEDRYRREKAAAVERSLGLVAAMIPGLRAHVVYTDAFTPRTVKQYTGHEHGAIYGSPHKLKDGRTDLANLYLCGTDQGMPGIVGAMVSGIAAANTFVLGAEGG